MNAAGTGCTLVGAQGMSRLFVYGDLRRGQPGHGVLEKVNARFVRRVRTGRGYALVSADHGGRGLVARLSPTGGPGVAGEEYDVAAAELPRVDAHEDAMYTRTMIRLDDGSSAWAYVVEDQ